MKSVKSKSRSRFAHANPLKAREGKIPTVSANNTKFDFFNDYMYELSDKWKPYLESYMKFQSYFNGRYDFVLISLTAASVVFIGFWTVWIYLLYLVLYMCFRVVCFWGLVHPNIVLFSEYINHKLRGK